MVYTITPVTAETKRIEKVGSHWKQFFISFIATLPFFTQALETTDLPSSFQFSDVPPTNVPWTKTSQIIAAIIFTPVFSSNIDKYGRKVGLYLVILSQGMSCIPLFLPPNDITSIFVFITTGITYSGLFITVPVYIREINDDEHRAMMMSLMMVMFSLGKIAAVVIGFDIVIYLSVFMITLEFLALFLILETPSYYVMMEKTERSFNAIGKLKCIQKDDAIISPEVNHLRDESNRAKDKGKLNIYRILKDVIWRDCTVIGVVLYSVTTLCGSSIFLDIRKTLLQLKMEQEPGHILVYVLLMAGSVFSFFLLSFLERKYLLTLGYSAMAFFLGILAVFTQADLTVTYSRWLPLVCLAVVIFAYGLIWTLPIILMTEMYNLQIRSNLLGLLFVYAQTLNLIHLHTLKYVEELMGVYTIFYVFASISLYGAVYSLFKIPDVKNKSVKQIEKALKRIPLIKL